MLFRKRDPYANLINWDVPWWQRPAFGPKKDSLRILRILAIAVFLYFAFVGQASALGWLLADVQESENQLKIQNLNRIFWFSPQLHPSIAAEILAVIYLLTAIGIYLRNALGWWGCLVSTLVLIRFHVSDEDRTSGDGSLLLIILPIFLYLFFRIDRSGIGRVIHTVSDRAVGGRSIGKMKRRPISTPPRRAVLSPASSSSA